MTLLLKSTNVSLLLGGQHIGNSLLNTQLLADGLRRHLVVACEHHHTQAHFPKPLDRSPAGFPDCVRHGNHAQQLVIPDKEQGRFPLLCQAGYNSFSGAHRVALKINGCATTGAGKLAINSTGFPVIQPQSDMALEYFAKISADAPNSENVNALNVVFTISIV